MPEQLDVIIGMIERIAAGDYSQEIMKYTTEEGPEECRRLAEAVGMMMVRIEAREYHLKDVVRKLEEANERLRINTLRTVRAITRAMGARDEYTRGHVERVAAYARRLALAAGLGFDDLDDVHMAGLLHDVGKIGFSDKVFQNEDTTPTPELMEEIRQHPAIGADILRAVKSLERAREYVYCHHERMDGKGYPRGLSGDEIPLGARILAVADVFDAVTTDRPYQKGMPRDEALGILDKLAGSSLDPDLVGVFKEVILENGLESQESL